MIMMHDTIDFGIWLTGHDEETIKQMFYDWNKRNLHIEYEKEIVKAELFLKKRYPHGGANKHSLFSYNEIIELMIKFNENETKDIEPARINRNI